MTSYGFLRSFWSVQERVTERFVLFVEELSLLKMVLNAKLIYKWCGSFDQSPIDQRNFDQSPIDQRFFDQRVPLTRGSFDQRVLLTRGSLWPEVPLTRGFSTRGSIWPEGLFDQRVYLTRGSIWQVGLFDKIKSILVNEDINFWSTHWILPK